MTTDLSSFGLAIPGDLVPDDQAAIFWNQSGDDYLACDVQVLNREWQLQHRGFVRLWRFNGGR
ncbi:MAG: hypothetical protein C1943_03850 [Halochromatium sp.]|nr:hypothetical protein [Halochromatium sp.]